MIKNRINILLPLVFLIQCQLLAAPVPKLVYVGKVPLLVSAGRLHTPGTTSHIYLLNGPVRVSLLPRGATVAAEHSMNDGSRPISRTDQLMLQYRICTNSKQGTWRPMNELLLDTTINWGDSLVLQFRNPYNGKQVQDNSFICLPALPIASHYRSREGFDTAGNTLDLYALLKKRDIPFLQSIKSKQLWVGAGRSLQLVFGQHDMQQDSCLEYRLRDTCTGMLGPWQLCGKLLSLPVLPAGSSYLLDLRYAGMDTFNNYSVTTGPYWYQQTGIQVLGLLVVGALLLMAQQMKLRKERLHKQQAQEKLKTLQAQLHPHFVSNAIYSVMNLVRDGQQMKARHFLQQFAGLMRGTVESSNRLFGTLEQELDILERYLRLEKLRLGFTYTIEAEDGIDLNDIKLPPLLLQPAVENAVKHGMEQQKGNGHIGIRLYTQENNLVISITDNGGGKDVNAGTGQGLQLVKQRIDSLGRLKPHRKVEFSLQVGTTQTDAIFIFRNGLNKTK